MEAQSETPLTENRLQHIRERALARYLTRCSDAISPSSCDKGWRREKHDQNLMVRSPASSGDHYA